jgi:hypothetical protein
MKMKLGDRKDYKEFETYTRCKNCNYEITHCDSCECPFGNDETVYCYTKKDEKGKFHVCVGCFEGEND